MGIMRSRSCRQWLLMCVLLLPFGAHAITLTPNSNGSGQLPSGHNEITFNTYDGDWVRYIALPSSPSNGARVTINSSAGYWSSVDAGRMRPTMSELRLDRGDSYTFTYRSSDGGYWQITGGNSVHLYSPNWVGAYVPLSGRKLGVYTVANGDWVENIVLPGAAADGNRVAIVSIAGFDTKVDARHRVGNSTVVIKYGETYVFRYSSRDGGWITEDMPGRVVEPEPDNPPDQDPAVDQSVTLTPNSNGGGQMPSGFNEITFNTSDGDWIYDITLPENPTDGARVTMNVSASSSSVVDVSRVQPGLGRIFLGTGYSVSFTYRSNGDLWEISGGNIVNFHTPNTVGSNIPNSSGKLTVYKIGNGDWVDNIVLPASSTDGNQIAVISSAGSDSKVDSRHRVLSDTALVKNGDSYLFRYSSAHGGWLTETSPERLIKAADLNNGTFSPTSPLTRIEFADGSFVRDLNLPGNAGDGDRLVVTSSASLTANINNVRDVGTVKLDTNSQYELVYVTKDRQWVLVNNIPSTVYRAIDLQDGKIPRLTRLRTIIEMWNGNWTDKIYLPMGTPKGYQVTVKSQAESRSAVHGIDNNNDMSVPVNRGQTIAFRVDSNGKWVQETVTIDMLLVYSDKLVQSMGEQGIRAYAVEAFSLINDALENSAANYRVRIVGLEKVTPGPDWTTLHIALDGVRHSPEIQGMRNRLKADAVYYFGLEEGCGLALRNVPAVADQMIGTESVGCGVTSMRHEFGHMMGIHHNRAPDNNTDYYGFGYGPSLTILNGNAVPYYSSPKLLSPNYGVPMGIEGKIDALRRMNDVSRKISEFH